MVRSKVIGAMLFGPICMVCTMAAAQDVDAGKSDYAANCAICHGETGEGDGPFSALLTASVPGIRDLSQNNGGSFPKERVHQIIDGRAEVRAHGSRDMPIWGKEFNDEAAKYYREVWSVEDPETIVRTRIDGLVAYLETLQK